MLYVAVSAILYVLSFPHASLWPFAFIHFVPALFFLNDRANCHRIIKGAFLYSTIISFGMGYWILSALIFEYHIAATASIFFFFAAVIFPYFLFFLLIFLIIHLLKRESAFFYILTIPALFTVFEYLQTKLPVMIPALVTGRSLAASTIMMQSASIWGEFGLSFIVFSINGLIFLSIKCCISEKKINLKMTYFASSAILLLLVIALFGWTEVRSFRMTSSQNPITAKIVQGNFSNNERWSEDNFANQYQTYLSMTEKSDERRIILWPETILNFPRAVNRELFLDISQHIGENSVILTGGVRNNKEKTFNSIYLISGRGKISYYDKRILLPFAETTPFGDILGAYQNAPSQFDRGERAQLLESSGIRAGVSICLETLYSDHVRESVLAGGEIIVNLSNDNWFGNSAEPYIHHNAAKLRAVENRRYMLRCSNSGISAIIAPTGEIIKESSLFKREHIDGKISLTKEKSIYTRYGNFIILISIALLFVHLCIWAKKS